MNFQHPTLTPAITYTHTMTLTPTPIQLASPMPFKPHIPPPAPLWPLSRWHLFLFFVGDDASYHLPWCLPNQADSAMCTCFQLCKKNLCIIHPLQSSHSALTLPLAITSLVLLQMLKSLAGLSNNIQTVTHTSSPFSMTITSSSILPLTTHPVIGDNASFSLKRPCSFAIVHIACCPQPIVRSHDYWFWVGMDSCMVKHIQH